MAAHIVLDVGSSSVRATTWVRGAAPPHALSVEPLRPRRELQLHPASGTFGAQSTADSVTATLCEALAALLQRHPRVSDVTLAIASFACSWVGLDATNAPVTPLFCYAFRGEDTAMPAALGALSRECDAAAHHDRVGSPLHPAYVPAMLRATGPWPQGRRGSTARHTRSRGSWPASGQRRDPPEDR